MPQAAAPIAKDCPDLLRLNRDFAFSGVAD